MPRHYKRKTPEEGGRVCYDPKIIMEAVDAIRTGRMSQKAAAAFYGVPRSSLIRKLNRVSQPGISTGGRRLVFSEEEEEDIVKYLEIVSVCGEGLTKTETRNLVQQYVRKNNIKTRFRDDRPGYDWYINFMKRHPNLSRKSGYAQFSMDKLKDVEPFEVYRFYEDLQKLYNQSCYTEDDRNLIYSFDECEFPYHTQDDKKTEKSNPLINKNTLVLACGSASGQQLSPFILFKGKFVPARWVSAENQISLNSESEFKEHNIFEIWFNSVFLNKIVSLTERQDKPVTLIFNGSNNRTENILTLNIFQQCVQHKIYLVRLPQSLIWELQPLQKSCFKEIKNAWNNLKCKQTLSKNAFIQWLDEIWNNNVTGENLVSGFENSGIFPVNQNLFPRHLFRPGSLSRYEEHITENIPETVVVVVTNGEVEKSIVSTEIKLEVNESEYFTPEVKLDAESNGDLLRPVEREERNKNIENDAFKNPPARRGIANKFGKIMLMNKIIRQRAMIMKCKAKGSSFKTKWMGLGESYRKASSTSRGSDKDGSSFQPNLALSTSVNSNSRDNESDSLLPDEMSESSAEVFSPRSDPLTQPSKIVSFSPSTSVGVYNTSLPSCLSVSKNFCNHTETGENETETNNPSYLPGVVNDAYTKFFQSMADTVRDLPLDLQIVAKRCVLHEVTECELTALNRFNGSKN